MLLMPYGVIQEITGECISKERLILCLYYRGLYKGRIILPWETFCDPTERLQQTQVLLDFIRTVEKSIWWDENPVILGGDFNINLNITEEREAYDQIVDFGFIDTYSTANGCYSCCSGEESYLGCTYAVLGNPYSGEEEFKRIDYIFVI